MEHDFERYAEARIPQLKTSAAALMADAAAKTAEAEALQKALTDFRARKRGNGRAAEVIAASPVGRPVASGSQSQNILAALDAAGSAGRSITELYDDLAPVTGNKASVRSVVWTLKKAGKILPRNDRYFALRHVS